MIANITFLIVLILVALSLYLGIRNNKVYYFKISFGHFLFDELMRILKTYKDDDEFSKDEDNLNIIREKVYFLLNKHSYNKYLFSFKPLKLEKWFTEEELEFIKYLKQYRNEVSNV
jgi:hypothetical protein